MGAWSLGSHVALPASAARFSRAVLGWPFSCFLCFQWGLGLGAWELDQPAVHVLHPCQGQERAWAPVEICVRPANVTSHDRLRRTGHGRKENAFILQF